MTKSAANPANLGHRGLICERRYTTPGVHPFDEVEWELRDAVIGDPDNPAFDQPGVEFPKSWSQNATNIVAQKYFRGRLGSAERESSVRQMISRVAGTITGWGRDGGYFATDDDADAFPLCRLIRAGEYRRERGAATRFNDEPQRLPQHFLRHANGVVGDQDHALDVLARDGKHQFADLSGGERVGRDGARRRSAWEDAWHPADSAGHGD